MSFREIKWIIKLAFAVRKSNSTNEQVHFHLIQTRCPPDRLNIVDILNKHMLRAQKCACKSVNFVKYTESVWKLYCGISFRDPYTLYYHILIFNFDVNAVTMHERVKYLQCECTMLKKQMY